MSNYTFSKMPTVGISRSRFERTSQHKTSFNLGEIIPIYVDEVLPGDTRSMDLASLVRMSTPIAPLMDNIYLDYFAFFVPNRLVWDHWKEFMGENLSGAGIPQVSYSVPSLKLSGSSSVAAGSGSLLTYFGIPEEAKNMQSPAYSPSVPLFINALPFRAYHLVYREWFRNQNVDAPKPLYTGDNEGCVINALGSGQVADNTISVYTACKLPDYFTKALPYAQKGDAVKIPMAGFAPLATTSSMSNLNSVGSLNIMRFGDGSGNAVNGLLQGYNGDVTFYGSSSTPSGAVGSTNLGINLASLAGTIDQLRYAFQLQKLLWKDAAYGSRYWELLASHFGITAPDASLQRPEYLGGKRMNINIDQVLSTAGYSNTSSTTVGAPGANSVSSFKGSLFTKSFTEHGTLLIVAVARQDETYCNGLNRMFSRKDRFDYYWPVFANLGSQDIKYKEINLKSSYSSGDPLNDDVFGYQEAWAEYRFKPSICSGLLNPCVTGSLNFWTLANDFTGGVVNLDSSFIHADRSNIQRALVTSSTGPDFIADFYFRDIAVRPMPMFSLPGFADHH